MTIELSDQDKQYIEEEAMLEAEHYVVAVLQDYDSRGEKLTAKLLKDLKHWEKVLNSKEELEFFVSEFNKRVPDFVI